MAGWAATNCTAACAIFTPCRAHLLQPARPLQQRRRCGGCSLSRAGAEAGGQHAAVEEAGAQHRTVRLPLPEDYPGTWLSDLEAHPSERINVADRYPDRAAAMQEALRATFDRIDAPAELRRGSAYDRLWSWHQAAVPPPDGNTSR